MKLAIIKYNAGNVRSVCYAFERLGVRPLITDDPETIVKADKVVFPGVGEAGTTMEYLKQNGLDEMICRLKQPVLGICLGMQLLCRYSEESDTECLGVFNAAVARFRQMEGYKIPHMGWNLTFSTGSLLLDGMDHSNYFYFVHSYYVPLNMDTAAQTEYIVPFSAVMCRDNFHAVQFHPERSGRAGERLLKNFLRL